MTYIVKRSFVTALAIILLGNFLLAYKEAAYASVNDISENAQEQSLGRIFTSRQQRHAIDKVRNDRLKRSQSKADAAVNKLSVDNVVEVQALPIETQSAIVKFAGYMVKGDGSKVIWVDAMTAFGEPAADLQIVKAKEGEAGVVFVSKVNELTTKRLRPGQVWLIETDQVREQYDLFDSIESMDLEIMQPEDTTTDAENTQP